MGSSFPSRKELTVMRLLRDNGNNLYGLELVTLSNGELKQGSIYVFLDRLQQKGFVESKVPKNSEHPGIPRPRYRLNALGERALAAGDMMLSKGAFA